MSALAKTAVDLRKRQSLNQRQAELLVMKVLDLTLSAQGTVANPIDAATLGFTKIHSCSNAVKDDDTLIIVASPSYDGTKLLLKAAGTNAPADATGVFRVTIFGR